jgi:RNA polymerase sigma-70 factor (ECF subfamily)
VSTDPSSIDPRSDAELLDAARAGDVRAFEVVYLRHRDWIVRLARRWVSSDADALDVLQDTFVYVLDCLPDFQLRARFTTFLFPVIRNLALARRRRNARQESLEVVAEPTVPAGAAEPPDDLAIALGALPEQQRTVVLLRFVDELPLADIAARLRIPVGTVKSRLHLALRTLRDDPRTRRYFLTDGQDRETRQP